MKVYLLFFDAVDCQDFFGAFSTLELAKQHAETIMKNDDYYRMLAFDFCIRICAIDNPAKQEEIFYPYQYTD